MKKKRVIFSTIMMFILFLGLIAYAEVSNSQYFADPGISNGEVLNYQINNVKDSAKNRTLTMITEKTGNEYNVTLEYVYEAPESQVLNNIITGTLRTSDMRPISCLNVVNGEVYYKAEYGSTEVTITSNFNVIPELSEEESATETLELEDVVLDCELYMFQIRGLLFNQFEEANMTLYVDSGFSLEPDYFSGEVEVLGEEVKNGINCYKITAEATWVPGEVYGWYEKAAPHRLIYAEIDIVGNTDGDRISLIP